MAFARKTKLVEVDLGESIDKSPRHRFTYVPLPDHVVKYLEKFQNTLVPSNGIKQAIDHITLIFIPKAETDIIPSQIDAATTSIKAACLASEPIEANISGWAYFDGAQKDGQPVTAVVALVNAPQLGSLQAKIKESLEKIGFPPSNRFGFIPHITFCYLPKGERLKELPALEQRFTIEDIAFANNKIYQFKLGMEKQVDESVEITEKKKHKKKRKGKGLRARSYNSVFPPLFPDRMGTPNRFGGNWGPNPNHQSYGSDTAGAAPAGSHAFSEEDTFERIYQEWSGQYKSGEMTGPTAIGVTTQDSTYPDQNQDKVDTGRYDWRNSSGLGFKTEKANTVWKMALDIMEKHPELSETAILMTAFQRAQFRMDQFAPEEVRLLQMGIQWYCGETGARNSNVDKSAFGQSKAPSH
jgi:2'-5' RNA ligase